MKRILKLSAVFILTIIVTLSVCSCGCRAKDEQDSPQDPPTVSDKEPEQQDDDRQQPSTNPSESVDPPEQTPSLPSQPELSADDSDTSNDGTGTADNTGGTVGPSNKIVVVIIEDNQVFINGEEYRNADELKNYIELVNNDSRIFKLYDSEGIQATSDWVRDVFEDLQVEVIDID